MKKRETLIEMFSTFLKVDDYKDSLGPGWETDFRLKLSLSRQMEADLTAKEEFWAQYFLQEALQNPDYSLRKSHLCAYLEEVCYWTTIKILKVSTASDQPRAEAVIIVILRNFKNLILTD